MDHKGGDTREESGDSNYTISILHEGYSESIQGGTRANSTCVLVKGKKNVIVDTMTPWDGEFILKKLEDEQVTPSDIDFVVSTHGHSDHCGNNNLFLRAVHIVGFTISHKNVFYDHKFEEGAHYEIDDFVHVIPTPGHMLAHVSVLVQTADRRNVVIAGDLFENEQDIHDDRIWREAGSEDEMRQRESRQRILDLADFIIPGHGKMFEVKHIKA